MRFETFKKMVNLSEEDICRELFLENREKIKIKKEGVAVKNLVKIFDAALAISNKKGFTAMSLRELSTEAGLSMGALYTYFSSKEELLDMIQTQGQTLVVKVLADQIEGIDDPHQKLRRAIQTHLYLSEVMQLWFYFAYMETKNLNKDTHKKAIEAELFTENIFSDIVEEGIAAGLFATVEGDLTAAVIKAVLQDWYLKRWKYRRRKVSVEDYARFVMDFVESYLLPSEKPEKSL
ncbi:MAG TPA: TetR/AcrR family transcriptional regulator [Syntrophales bacterium]|nr:TetR/AcrR family transcriptional regulator [Syntrophales bacterium]HPQ42751.1 TetR/AcrR family transcriptional regulator [Syntrophales bacterium]